MAACSEFTDSIWRRIEAAPDDSDKVQLLHEMAMNVRYDDFDSALALCNKALKLAQKLRWYEGVGNSYRKIGIMYDDHGDYKLSLASHQKSLQVWWMEMAGVTNGDVQKRRSLLAYIAMGLNNMGVVYSNMSDYSRSLERYLKALKIDELIGDENGIAADVSNIALVYYEIGEYEKALEFNGKALELSKKLGHNQNTAINLGNRGSLYLDMKLDTLAEKCFKDALVISRKLNNKILTATWTGNIGTVFDRRMMNDSAMKYYAEALQMNQEAEYPDGIIRNLGGIGNVHIRLGETESAYDFLKKQMELAMELNAPEHILDAHQNQYRYFEAIGDYAMALEHFEFYTSLSDTLNSSERNKTIARSELRYIYEKEKELEDHERERELDVAVQERHLSEYRKLVWAMIASFALLGAVLILLRQGARNKRERETIRLQQRLVQSALDNSRLERQYLELDVTQSLEKLSRSTIQMQQKSKLLDDLQSEFDQVRNGKASGAIKTAELFSVIRQRLNPEEYWPEFMANFNLVYKNFLGALTSRFPDVTRSEIRMCILLKCDLPNKEIASILHIDNNSVKKAQNRVRKRLHIAPENSLREFILQLA